MDKILVQGGRIKKKKRSSDRSVDGVTLREPGFAASIRIAPAVRTEASKEEVMGENVRNHSTLTLHRICARDIHSDYNRMWRCYVD